MNRPLLSVLVAGVLFGAGLVISGMTDPSRVIAFLDVAGHWDYSLAFVMCGAVGTFGLGLLIWRKLTNGCGLFGTMLPVRDPSPIDRSLVLGSVVFGVGWGLGGFCPGPAIANLSALRIEALVFVPMMALGMLLARLCFGVDQD
ncbi:MAG: hypothetical protein QM760_01335 [Nibricoccus sp.]